MSENIRVTSIIDRFLEHSRIYVFGTGEEAEVFLSSADWMPRNFVRRVEVMFPVLQPSLKKHILEQILPVMFSDNVKTREMQSDGSYRRVVRPANTPALRAQIRLLAGLPMDDTPEGEVEK
jgi:polyphosphate kinase